MERFWGEIIPERPRKADPRIEGLMDALGELSEAKQTLLRKHYFEGKSVAVIAEESHEVKDSSRQGCFVAAV